MTEPALLMLCAIATGLPQAKLGSDRVTLVWQHSVEKTECREEWFLTEAGLTPGLTRIRGSGAGIAIPSDAKLSDGWWVYRSTLPPLPGLTLARSGATPSDWLLCQETLCQPLEAILPGLPAFEPVTLAPCAQGADKVQRSPPGGQW